jgi:hypothetical protein
VAPGLTQSLIAMSTRNNSWGKGGRCVGLTTLPPSCAECLEIWEPQPSATLWDCCTFKGHPCHGCGRKERRPRYSSNSFAAWALEGMGSQSATLPGALPVVQTGYPLYWMGTGADLDGHAKSSTHRAFVMYRPVMVEPRSLLTQQFY